MSLDLQPWKVKKLDDDSFAYLVPDAAITTDPGKMVAHVIVSTPTMDRERDILLSKGCRTDNHRKLPAVLVSHKKQWPAVARAETPGGEYTVKCYEDRIESTNYFDQTSKLGMQTFRLVESKALSGVSPGFLTFPNHIEKVKGADGHPAFVYSVWDLVEISHVPIPMNPDALVLAVEKGFGSEALLPELKDLLTPYIPERKAQVVSGFEVKQLASPVEVVDFGRTPPIDLSDAEAVPLTPSTQFYHTLYQKAWDCLDMARELTDVQESERTRKDGGRIIGCFGAVLDVCREGHENHISTFPDQPGLPEGINSELLTKKMSEWRVKALDAWDEHKRNRIKAIAAESTEDIGEVLKFCVTLANDRQQRTNVRAVANRMAQRLTKIKMVDVPADDLEEAEWGAVAAKLDKVIVG